MVKNNSMYFWRIVFTYVIALHHLRNALGAGCGWYIGVDFFAVVSGFLLMEHMQHYPQETLFEYVKKRFCYFVPILFASGVLRLAVVGYMNHSSITECFLQLYKAIPSFLLLNSYMVSLSLNSVDWYVQSLFFVSIPIFWLLRKHREFTLQVIAPVCIIVFYSLLIRNFHALEGYTVEQLVVYFWNWNVVRVGAGVLLGVLCWQGVQHIHFQKNNVLLFLLEVLLLGGVIYLSKKFGKSPQDFIYVLMIAAGVMIGFSHQAFAFLNTRLVHFLSKISIYIYLNHYAIRLIFPQFMHRFSNGGAILYLLVVTVVSVAVYGVVAAALAGGRKYVVPGLKKLFL